MRPAISGSGGKSLTSTPHCWWPVTRAVTTDPSGNGCGVTMESTSGRCLRLEHDVVRVARVDIRLGLPGHDVLDHTIADHHIEDSAQVFPARGAVLRIAERGHQPGRFPDVVAAPLDAVADHVVVLPGVPVLELHPAPDPGAAVRAFLFIRQDDRVVRAHENGSTGWPMSRRNPMTCR